MNIETFEKLAIELVGTEIGWQKKIARKLNVQSRAVRRWVESREIPDGVINDMETLSNIKKGISWPREEWLVGETINPSDDKIREFIIHLKEPKFCARVVFTKEDGKLDQKDLPVDLTTSISFLDKDMILCEIIWFDKPKPGAENLLLKKACDAYLK